MQKKKKISFVLPYPLNISPGQRFRFEHYLETLSDKHTCSFFPFLSRKDYSKIYNCGRFTKTVITLKGYLKRWFIFIRLIRSDFIYIYRETSPFGPPILLWMVQSLAKSKIIYDFDDAIWLEDPSEKGSLLARLKYKKKVSQLCKMSWKVTVGNKFLAEYASKFSSDVRVIPTVVETEKKHVPSEKKSSSQITIGWTGSHSTLKYLEDLSSVLSEVSEKFNCRILVTANQPPHKEIRNLDFVPWSLENEIDVLNQMDIGIMPLPDNEWSKGKCGFKLIQYGSVGLPAVASRVGINSDVIIENKSGYLCETEQDWIEKLTILIQDKSLRHQMGKSAREHIVSNYSVKSSIRSFLTIFDSA